MTSLQWLAALMTVSMVSTGFLFLRYPEIPTDQFPWLRERPEAKRGRPSDRAYTLGFFRMAGVFLVIAGVALGVSAAAGGIH